MFRGDRTQVKLSIMPHIALTAIGWRMLTIRSEIYSGFRLQCVLLPLFLFALLPWSDTLYPLHSRSEDKNGQKMLIPLQGHRALLVVRI